MLDSYGVHRISYLELVVRFSFRVILSDCRSGKLLVVVPLALCFRLKLIIIRYCSHVAALNKTCALLLNTHLCECVLLRISFSSLLLIL